MVKRAKGTAEVRRLAIRRLIDAGVESPVLDANVLLGFVTQTSASEIPIHLDGVLDVEAEQEFEAVINRRVCREPVAYITGTKAFRRIEVGVTPDVLIPRPETELVVESAMNMLDSGGCSYVLDVGTGSGAIALALADERPMFQVIGVDRSYGAVQLASWNVRRLGFCDRVCSCLADGVQGFDLCDVLVVANLPYIRSCDIELLQPEIRCWEPILALDGGSDGLFEIRKLIDQLVGSMARGVVLEIGVNHGPEVVRMLRLAGFDRTDVHRDFSGFPRVVTAQRSISMPV